MYVGVIPLRLMKMAKILSIPHVRGGDPQQTRLLW